VVCDGDSPCFRAAAERILSDKLLSTLNYAASLVNRTLPSVANPNIQLTAEFKGAVQGSLRAPPSLSSVVCAIWGGGETMSSDAKCGGRSRVELNCAEGLMHEEWEEGEGVAPLRSMEELRSELVACLQQCAGVAREEMAAYCAKRR
jgi:hypothetical protein